MTNRDRVAFVVVPPGYASAEEFANDCGYELFVPAINPPVQDAELATIAELAEHSPSSTNMIAGWKLASIAQELLSRRAQLAEVAAWMREENRSEQNKPPVYEFAVGSDSPPGGGWISLQRINISGATGITSEQHEANARLRSISTDLLASVKELREAAAAMMRVIANHVELISEMGVECQRAGVKDGFGKRAQEAIAEAESADWLEQQKRYFYRMCIGPSAPKSHAEVHSSELRDALWDLLNDCINFDGGHLTESIMLQASRVLKKVDGIDDPRDGFGFMAMKPKKESAANVPGPTSAPSAADVLLKLAERCEREDGSHALNIEIMKAARGYRDSDHFADMLQSPDGQLCNKDAVPHFVWSLDAAVTLVPEGFDWHAGWRLIRGVASLTGEDHRHCFDRAAKTPALALCAASLHARAALVQS